MISHENLLSYVLLFQQNIPLDTNAIVDFSSSPAFDMSITCLLMPSISGGSMSGFNIKDKHNPLLYLKHLKKHHVTLIKITPSYLHELLLFLDEIKSLYCLKLIILGGEKINLDNIALCHRLLKKISIINEYGPTETTVGIAYYSFDSNSDNNLSSIGSIRSPNYYYIIDNKNRLCSRKKSGELLIGGPQVARGYLNNPALTAEKFIANPFGSGRLYRTGDLVRELQDGNLEFIGRIDDQVKIRGFRIEPDEITACLLTHPRIDQALVLSKENTEHEKYLVAFIVFKTKQTLSATQLIAHLKQTLPDYMIPALFFVLEHFPLNQTGKIDRAQLRRLDEQNALPVSSYQPPETELQKQLQPIWSELLHRSPIGIDDNFFDLGGHSLRIPSLIIAVEKALHQTFSTTDIYQYPTIRALAPCLKAIPSVSQPAASPNIDIPLSKIQQLIWVHQQTAPDQPIYNEPMTITMPRPVNIPRLEQAINTLLQRHHILRAQFYVNDGIPCQRIEITAPVQLHCIQTDTQTALQLATDDCKKPFRLSQDLLIRFLFVELPDHTHQLFITTHHLIVDGISMFQIFFKELEQLYRGHELPAVSWQYMDMIASEKKVTASDQQFWKDYLSTLPILNLPQQKQAPITLHYRGHRQVINFADIAIDRLQIFAQHHHTTLFTVLFAAFHLLIYQYSQQKDLAIGTLLSIRDRDETQSMMGNFLNNIIVRSNIDTQMSFDAYLLYIWNHLKQVYAHAHVSWQELSALLPKGRMPIQAAFVYEPGMYQSPLGWRCSQLLVHPGTTKFDLTFELDQADNHLMGRVEYSTDCFADWFIASMIAHFHWLLNNILQQPQQSIAELIQITKQDQQQLDRWNQTDVPAPPYHTLVAAFEAQAERTPYQTAIVDENQTITYEALNAKANQLAHYLIEQGASTKTLIALCMPKGIPLIITMLGVLKSGAAYVPIDPDTPQKRKNYILKDTQAHLCLQELPKINGYSNANPRQPIHGENLAYVIYTSGSTGDPKGVMIKHESVLNTLISQINIFELRTKHTVCSTCHPMFDGFISEIFTTLLSGATLFLFLSTNLKYLQNKPYTMATIIPSRLKSLTHNLMLDKIIMAGESCSLALMRKWSTKVTLNVYGPTETAICATAHYCLPKDSYVSIGRPLANTKIYILNDQLQPLPIGCIGEICISGIGLATGYLNQPTLTAEKFISNPFCNQPPYNRLYRSGDLGRFWPDGNLEFIGRMDQQVKIRGFRIECGEVESALFEHPAIQQAAVIARTDSEKEKYLAAYFVAKTKLKAADLRIFLQNRLPSYMIPNIFVELDTIPMTSTGKVDRQQLPEPAPNSASPLRLPQTPTQKMLADHWKRLFGQKTISIDADFFEQGGNSLKAMQFLNDLPIQPTLTLKDLFQHPTIEQLAHYIDSQSFENSNLILINRHNDKPPLFLVHPIGGTVFCYYPLAQQLKRPIYAIQDPSVQMEDPLFDSVESMAAYYIKMIKAICPTGPYHLGGYSSGATVAVEMAHQLGDVVRDIMLIDGWAHYPDSIKQKAVLEDSLKRQQQQWQKQIGEQDLLLEKLLKLQWQRAQLFEQYRIPPISSPLILFKAQEILPFFKDMDSLFNHWDRYAQQPITVHHITGTHQTVLEKNNIQALVALCSMYDEAMIN